MRDLQNRLQMWVQHNFPQRDYLQPTLGVGEEIGELAEHFDSPHIRELVISMGRLQHEVLKHKQQIRGQATEHEEKIRDAIGDITIFLMDICNACGWDYEATVRKVWDEVEQRDWQKHRAEAQSGSD